MWENGASHDKAAAADHFLKSAKLDPGNAAAFKYLGDYYATSSVDIQRALKCYQRAVSLDVDDFHSGVRLSFYFTWFIASSVSVLITYSLITVIRKHCAICCITKERRV